MLEWAERTMVSKVALTSPASLCTACKPSTLSRGLFFMIICAS